MLRTLRIENYAIIESLSIDFSTEMNVITGETGAGKSIIVGALGLILGQRADSSLLVSKDRKCIVEGVFDHQNRKAVKHFLTEHELDVYDELVIRREIGINGKSRAFVNDTPVNLDQLEQLSSLLVDLHQQFDTYELGESDFQRAVLDSLAGHQSILEEYRSVYRKWSAAGRDLQELTGKKLQFDKEADYNQYQYNELEEAAFTEGEIENIDAELRMLSHAEAIKGALNKVSYSLQESESPIVQQLKVLQNGLSAYGGFHPGLPAILNRLQSCQVELQDIADEVSRLSDHVQYDAGKVEKLNEKLSLGYKLLKKHGVKTTAELLEVQAQLEIRLQAVLNIDAQISQKEKEIEELEGSARKMALKISAGRKKQVKPFEEKVNRLLARVGMPNARISVQQTTEAALNDEGLDVIEFLFNGNVASSIADKTAPFQPLKKVASGGERSRLMLCIKSLVAESVDLPTMIFDEIDTGISGEAARQVGIIMKELAAKRQIICITHQPQIAGKANAHFFVYKQIVGDAIKTNIRQLDTEERITAIARMLSGEKPTAAAMENAREMVMN